MKKIKSKVGFAVIVAMTLSSGLMLGTSLSASAQSDKTRIQLAERGTPSATREPRPTPAATNTREPRPTPAATNTREPRPTPAATNTREPRPTRMP